MTDYIKKMMRTAGVESDAICKYASGNIVYTDFTPEKQLEIIKLISFVPFFNFSINRLICRANEDDKYRLNFYEIRGFKFFQAYNKDFTQALAQLTIELMTAGELDKEKVKEILE